MCIRDRNQATQNIRNYGTKWSDQKPVSTYSMSDESNLFDPDVLDFAQERFDLGEETDRVLHDRTGGGFGQLLHAQEPLHRELGAQYAFPLFTNNSP